MLPLIGGTPIKYLIVRVGTLNIFVTLLVPTSHRAVENKRCVPIMNLLLDIFGQQVAWVVFRLNVREEYAAVRHFVTQVMVPHIDVLSTCTHLGKRPSTQFPARLVIPTSSVCSRVFRVLQSVVGEFGFKFPNSRWPCAARCCSSLSNINAAFSLPFVSDYFGV